MIEFYHYQNEEILADIAESVFYIINVSTKKNVDAIYSDKDKAKYIKANAVRYIRKVKIDIGKLRRFVDGEPVLVEEPPPREDMQLPIKMLADRFNISEAAVLLNLRDMSEKGGLVYTTADELVQKFGQYMDDLNRPKSVPVKQIDVLEIPHTIVPLGYGNESVKRGGAQVLLCLATYNKKRYCFDQWLQAITQLEGSFDVLIVENTVGDLAFYKYILEKTAGVSNIQVHRMVFPGWQKQDFFHGQTLLCTVYNYMREYLLQRGYQHMFIVEADNVVKKDTLTRLLSHKKPIISATYFMRHRTNQVDAGLFACDINTLTEDTVNEVPINVFTEEDIHGKRLMKYEVGGFGTVLISRKALEKVKFRTSPRSVHHCDVFFYIDTQRLHIDKYLDTEARVSHLRESFDSSKDAQVLLIWPGARLPGWNSNKAGGSSEATFINHGLCQLSAVLKKANYTVSLIDLRTLSGWDEFAREIKNREFSVCMISFYSVDEDYARQCLRIVKELKPDVYTIAGGVHLTITRQQQFDNADVVVLGEGEDSVVELMQLYYNNRPLSRFVLAPPVRDLDSLPFIDRSLFLDTEKHTPFLPLMDRPMYSINFSRGCSYGKCTFCHQSDNRTRYRLRSVRSCIEEINQFGPCGSLMIHDDIFPPRKWCIEFVELWKSSGLPRIAFWCQMRADFIVKNPEVIEKLADIGLTWVSLGVESGSQRILDFLHKGTAVEDNYRAVDILHSNNVNIFMDLIFTVPTETGDDIDKTVEFVSKTRPAAFALSTYTCYPGSKLHKYCVDNNLFLDEHYSMTRYPYEQKIRGVDYGRVFEKMTEIDKMRGGLRVYSSRGSCKVSVIMISHNRPKYLSEAIQSLINQTDRHWEAIVLETSDDARCTDVLDGFRDSRIKVVPDTSDNTSFLWNRGIDLCEGEYITILDDDNRKTPSFIEKLSRFLDEHDSHQGVVSSFVEINDEGKISTASPFPLPSEITLQEELVRNRVDSSAFMFKKSVISRIGYFDERLKTSEDWDFVRRMLQADLKIGIINEPLLEYRMHSSNKAKREEIIQAGLGDRTFMQTKTPSNSIRVVMVRPPVGVLTPSQNTVIKGIIDGIGELNFVKHKVIFSNEPIPKFDDVDYYLLLHPLNIDARIIQHFVNTKIPCVTIHIEEPQAVYTNTARMQGVSLAVVNDSSVKNLYQSLLGNDNVYVWNNLSINYPLLKDVIHREYERIYDVTFVGHPYKSRIELISDIAPLVYSAGWSFVCVGDTWDKYVPSYVKMLPTLTDVETVKIMRQSKIVVVRDREHWDLGGPPISSSDIHRGYFELSSGALVCVYNPDRVHSFKRNMVHFFKDCDELLRGLNLYMSDDRLRNTMSKSAFEYALKNYTYTERMRKVLLAINSRRFNFVCG